MLSRLTPLLRNARIGAAFRPTTKMILPATSVGQVRNLNVHEYIGQELMAKYGIPVPRNAVALTPEEAEKAFDDQLGKKTDDDVDVVIKAQILAGGRGLGKFKNGFKGGVHVCTSAKSAKHFATKMLNQVLVTKQTGPDGKLVQKVLLSERLYLRRECYFSIMMDRASQGPVMVGCAEGGTSIEDLAASEPEKIIKIPVNILTGITDAQAQKMASGMGFTGDQAVECAEVVTKLYKMFVETDATLLEINPFAETNDGKIMVCDAKINFDDNAEFRQKEIFKRRDTSQEDPREVEAHKYDLNYIGLDGQIGCMVNGAGLAMATLDIISLHGGKAANFLDVGGGASASQVQKAFEILNADKSVKAILVNIFGGIMRCDVIAMGIIQAANNLGLKKPVIIRLQGTNVEKAQELIENSGYRMIVAQDLDAAAMKAVKIASIVKQAEEVDVDVAFSLHD